MPARALVTGPCRESFIVTFALCRRLRNFARATNFCSRSRRRVSRFLGLRASPTLLRCMPLFFIFAGGTSALENCNYATVAGSQCKNRGPYSIDLLGRSFRADAPRIWCSRNLNAIITCRVYRCYVSLLFFCEIIMQFHAFSYVIVPYLILFQG